MRTPRRILHVLGRLDRGGAEIRTLELFQRIDRRQYEFHFCVLSGLPGALDHEVRALGGEVHPLKRSSAGFPQRFRRLLRREQYDVVHSQVLYFSGVVLRLAAECGIPVRVAQLHNTHDGHRSGPIRRVYRRWMLHWIDRYATDVVAVSEGVMAGIWGPQWTADPRCQVVYNGVETTAFEDAADGEGVRHEFGLPCDTPLCIHVGRACGQKNHRRLAAIFAAVCRLRPSARLMLVGASQADLDPLVGQRFHELGIEDKVIYCGKRSDVPRLLKAADVMIFPSLWEGLPGAVQEACAAGTPVVASDLPGTREVVERLRGVRLLSLGEPDAHWACAIEAAMADRATNKSREQARRSFAGSVFTIDECLKRHCRIWRGAAPDFARRKAA